MPLLKGSSQSIITENIKGLRNSGKSEKSATTTALRNAKGSPKKPAGKKFPQEMRIKPAANGGFVVHHEQNNNGSGPYKDAVPHAIANGPALLAHVQAHLGGNAMSVNDGDE